MFQTKGEQNPFMCSVFNEMRDSELNLKGHEGSAEQCAHRDGSKDYTSACIHANVLAVSLDYIIQNNAFCRKLR